VAGLVAGAGLLVEVEAGWGVAAQAAMRGGVAREVEAGWGMAVEAREGVARAVAVRAAAVRVATRAAAAQPPSSSPQQMTYSLHLSCLPSRLCNSLQSQCTRHHSSRRQSYQS